MTYLPKLLIQEADGSPKVIAKRLDVSNGTLTDSGSGVATLSSGGGTITVKEIDGTPNVSGVSTIRFTNGTLTDDGSGQVTITISGTGAVVTDTIWDAKGDLAVATAADTAAKLTVGSDYSVLQALASETTGTRWTGGAWTTYTPTWTASTNPAIGNGTLQGAYFQIGKILFLRIDLVMGSTTTYGSGNWSFGLPSGITSKTGAQQVLQAIGVDAGTAFRDGMARLPSASTTFEVVSDSSATRWQSTSPHTWASTDSLAITGTIEID